MPGSMVPTEWFRAAPWISPCACTSSTKAPFVDVTRAAPTSGVRLSTVPPAASIAAVAASAVPLKETTYSSLAAADGCPAASSSEATLAVAEDATTALTAEITPRAPIALDFPERRNHMARPFPGMPVTGADGLVTGAPVPCSETSRRPRVEGFTHGSVPRLSTWVDRLDATPVQGGPSHQV